MLKQVPPQPELVAGEHEILSFWKKNNTFEKLRARNADGPPWSFLDGPITANGFMGVHHAWGRTYKDAFQRYFAMTGHNQRWQNGFDCQGLWVEVQVERDLGFKSKRDIENYGIERFVQLCKERVLKYSAIQTAQSVRLGMWMDWAESYFTMSDENNYMIWAFLKKTHQRGFVYKGLDAMPWCPRCGTGISEQERKEGYKQVTDQAVYVRLPLKGKPNEYLLVWTTTPWTLPANVAAAVNPDLTYIGCKLGTETYWLANTLMAALASGPNSAQAVGVSRGLKGSEMVGWEYGAPFDFVDAAGPARDSHRIIEWDEVTDTTGTGIVHIAPGCGKEDFDLGRTNSLPIISPIDESGVYYPGFGPLSGKPASEANPTVFAELESKGYLFKIEPVTHDYPHCWRCSTPLLYRAVDEWYIDMQWRDEIKANVSKINWIPSYGRDLELDWLKNMGDWMISKKRYWGLALPIYECSACRWFDVIGSREELEQRAVEGWSEFVGGETQPRSPHRPWIDLVKIACEKCGGTASRIPDVGNPWLDAGIVPYSTVRYGTDRDYWEKWIPADFVTESFPGQFRNWFYALLTMSTMMENVPPFKTLLGYASVRDESGEEMHYSHGNAIEFDQAADKMGADVMRWMYCRHIPTNNLNFGFAAGEQLERKVFGTLWNSYLFFVNYARLDQFDPKAPKIPAGQRPQIDRWILSELNLLAASGRKGFEQYWISPFMRQAEEFLDQLSNWYIRRNRQRFWDPRGKDETGKVAAYQTLYEVLTTFVKLVAPVIPFLAERMYGNLVLNAGIEDEPESVHLCEYPVPANDQIDAELGAQMAFAQQVVAAGRSLREQNSLRVRQPLSELRIRVTSEGQGQGLSLVEGLITDELNVKELSGVKELTGLFTLSGKPNFATLGPKHGKQAPTVASAIAQLGKNDLEQLKSGKTTKIILGNDEVEIEPSDVVVHLETLEGWGVSDSGPLQIALDIRITPELEKEGLARDVVRHIQQLRKDIGLNIEDHIECAWKTSDTPLKESIEEWKDYIAAETQADSLVEGSIGLSSHDVEIGPYKLELEMMLHTGG